MREELINLLQQRVGLDRQKAEQAVDVIMNYVKEQSPDRIRSLMGEAGLGKFFGS